MSSGDRTPQTFAAAIEHKERRYQSYPGSNYVLPSDAAEKERLALQHNLLLHVLENRLIIPNVVIEPEDHILESGAGSGTWLLDIFKAVPGSVVIHGLDIEPGLLPKGDPAVLSRGNVQFDIGSITSLPADWDSKFRLVHQRLLIAALRREEWERGIAEMFRVLTPGGWVQLEELGEWTAGPETAKFTALANSVAKAKDLVIDCALLIPDMLRRAGFANVTIEQKLIPLGSQGGRLAVDARNNWMGAFRGMKTPVLKAGGLGHVSSEAEYDSMMDAMEKEMEEMPTAEMQYYVFYAQKPLV
ncbi:S-adenosyl-L-methionine-dependent methyltransferase [Daedalea quercina L-15889]|uniref:S-adenosyl-L-methionine-dependent methyltransferase n=1 Tax=Daedalea quercina L-15889 TaxID=1314783 RepID=A0A165N392_9APHY|nr:S-adenosyl-L-methionine-dependent methyltransferase [Daedalea quercina L-15889]